jgi:hypothetical protein
VHGCAERAHAGAAQGRYAVKEADFTCVAQVAAMISAQGGCAPALAIAGLDLHFLAQHLLPVSRFCSKQHRTASVSMELCQHSRQRDTQAAATVPLRQQQHQVVLSLRDWEP